MERDQGPSTHSAPWAGCLASPNVLETGPSPWTHCRLIESALTRSSVTRTRAFEKPLILHLLLGCTREPWAGLSRMWPCLHGVPSSGAGVLGAPRMSRASSPHLELPAEMEIEHSIFLGCFRSNCIASSFIFFKVSQR